MSDDKDFRKADDIQDRRLESHHRVMSWQRGLPRDGATPTDLGGQLGLGDIEGQIAANDAKLETSSLGTELGREDVSSEPNPELGEAIDYNEGPVAPAQFADKSKAGPNPLDEFSAPAGAPPKAVNKLDDFSAPAGPSPQQKAVVKANDNGEEAARALGVAKRTGIPAPLVQSDLPAYAEHDRTQTAIKYVNENPFLAKYVDGNPMAASVSADDYSALDTASKAIQELSPGKISATAHRQVVNSIPELNEALSTAPGRAKLAQAALNLPFTLAEDVFDVTKGGTLGALESLQAPASRLKQKDNEGFWGGFINQFKDLGSVGMGAFGLATSPFLPVMGAAKTLIARPLAIAEGAPLEEVEADVGKALLAAKPGTGFKAPPRTVGHIDDFLSELRGHQTRADIEEFIRKKAEGDGPPGAMLQIEHAKAGAEALDKAVETAQGSKTKERSPELFAEMANGHDPGNVHVDGQKIVELYEKEGKAPAEGDGLFGFVPGIAEKAQAAAATGGEVTIPVGDYVAHIDEAVHKQVGGSVRLHDDGVTLEEAKEHEKTIEAWHGTPHDFEQFDLTKIGTGEGAQVYGHGLYFAQQRDVAGHYANTVEPGSAADGIGLKGGNLYKVSIAADPTRFLDWDAMLSEQSLHVQGAVKALMEQHGMEGNFPGNELYHELAASLGIKDKSLGGTKGEEKAASKALSEAGIPGIKYLDQGSRPGVADPNTHVEFLKEKIKSIEDGTYDPKIDGPLGDKAERIAGLKDDIAQALKKAKEQETNATRNFVVFDDRMVKITEKNGEPVAALLEQAVEAEKLFLGMKTTPFLNMLFKDGKAVGITEPEINQYSKLIAEQEQAVLDKAVASGKREAARRLAPEWKRNEATVKGEVTDELTRSGAFAAEKYLRDHRIDIAHDNAALVADGLAPHFGFDNGQDLLRGLQSIETERAASGKGPQVQLRDAIKAETASRMEAKYGNLKENIAKQAREIALAEHSFDVMAEEIRLLAKANGVAPPLSRTELTAWAQQTFENSNIRDAGNWESHRRAVERGGRETEKALLKKDWQEAFQAKQRQMLAAEVARQSLKLQGVIDGAETRINRFSSEETIKSLDQGHLEQLRQMFASVGLPQHYAPLRDTVPLRDFVAEGEGQLAIAPWLMDGSQPKLQDMSVAQFRDFVKSMQSLEHAGREALKLRNAHGEALLENVVRDAVQSLERFPFIEQPTLNPSLIQRAKSYGRLVLGSHMLVEKVLDYTDRFNPHGPITEWLDRPLRDANTKEIVLTEMAVRKMRDLQQYVDASVLEEIPNKLITDSKMTNGFMKMNRGNLRILMANMGTWSNIGKTAEGLNVNEADLRRFIDQNTKPSDVAWVNGIWDVFAALKPEADAVSLRDTGVPVDSHPAVPWDIKAGSLTGGYFPISYDPRNSNIQAQISKPLFDSGYHTRNTITPHGYTEARTGYKGAIDLSGLNLATKIQSMIHDIAFREAVRNADKLIRHPDFKNAMENYWSNEVADLLPGWLRDIANAHNFEENYGGNLVRASSYVRQNVVQTLISLNPSTFFKHGAAAAIMSVDRVGLIGLLSAGKDIGTLGTLKGLGDLISHEARVPDEAFMQSFRDALDNGERGDNARQFMLDSSAVMRNRLRQYDDSIRGAVEAITLIGPAKTFDNVRQRSMQLGRLAVAFSDQLSAQTTWMASYKAAYAKGEAHADAVFIADRDVSRTHGSSFIGDQPAVTRLGNSGPEEIAKYFTQFFKFWSHQVNNNLQLVWDMAAKIRGPAEFEPLQGGGGQPPLVPPNVLDFSKDKSGDWRYSPEPGARAARIVWGMLQIAAFIYIEEAASSLLAPNDKDKHGFGARMALAMLRYFGAQSVFTRDFTHAKAGGYEPSTGMMGTLWKGLSDTIEDMNRTGQGKKVKNWIKHTAMTVGSLTGVGSAQLGRTAQGLVGYATGNEHPKGVADWTQLLSKGSVKGRVHK